MPADTLYENDIVAWAEQQAQAIREIARQNPGVSNAVDWENVAEEIGDMGRSQVQKFNSLLRQFLIHLAKTISVGGAQASAHWLAEADVFRNDFIPLDTQSLRRKVDLDAEWRAALRIAARALQAHGDQLSNALPSTCPLSLAELVDTTIELDDLVRLTSMRLGGAPAATPIGREH